MYCHCWPRYRLTKLIRDLLHGAYSFFVAERMNYCRLTTRWSE